MTLEPTAEPSWWGEGEKRGLGKASRGPSFVVLACLAASLLGPSASGFNQRFLAAAATNDGRSLAVSRRSHADYKSSSPSLALISDPRIE